MNKKDWLRLMGAISGGADDVSIILRVSVKHEYEKMDLISSICSFDFIDIRSSIDDIDQISLIEDRTNNTVEIICEGTLQ